MRVPLLLPSQLPLGSAADSALRGTAQRKECGWGFIEASRQGNHQQVYGSNEDRCVILEWVLSWNMQAQGGHVHLAISHF